MSGEGPAPPLRQCRGPGGRPGPLPRGPAHRGPAHRYRRAAGEVGAAPAGRRRPAGPGRPAPGRRPDSGELAVAADGAGPPEGIGQRRRGAKSQPRSQRPPGGGRPRAAQVPGDVCQPGPGPGHPDVRGGQGRPRTPVDGPRSGTDPRWGGGPGICRPRQPVGLAWGVLPGSPQRRSGDRGPRRGHQSRRQDGVDRQPRQRDGQRGPGAGPALPGLSCGTPPPGSRCWPSR
jgi:hypothetical protein